MRCSQKCQEHTLGFKCSRDGKVGTVEGIFEYDATSAMTDYQDIELFPAM